MNWYKKCLKQYADFSGRARRKEYWMFFLFNTLFGVGLIFIGSMLGVLISGGDEDVAISIGYGLYFLYALAIFIPGLAVCVRRLHDVGKSGWWFLISLVPFIGGIWLFVLLVTDSEDENQYGRYPK